MTKATDVIEATLAEHDAYSIAYNCRIDRFPREGSERRLAHAAGFTEGWEAAVEAIRDGRFKP